MIKTPVKISKRITIGPSPSAEFLKKLRKQGFKSVINLSKKGEMDQSLKPVEEGKRVDELGLEYHHIPVSLSNIKDEQITDFCKHVATLPKPIYVHCRIGQRAGPFALICMALNKGLGAEAALLRAKELGLNWKAPMISSLITQYLKKNKVVDQQA